MYQQFLLKGFRILEALLSKRWFKKLLEMPKMVIFNIPVIATVSAQGCLISASPRCLGHILLCW